MNKDTEAERERLIGRLNDELSFTSHAPHLAVELTQDEARALLTALRQRGEEGEPVGWVSERALERVKVGVPSFENMETLSRFADDIYTVPLYAAPVPVASPVGMREFEELVDEYDRQREMARTWGGESRAKAHAARAALLDAYRRGGAVGDEAWRKEYDNLLFDVVMKCSALTRAESTGNTDRFEKADAAYWKARRALDAHVLSRPSGSGDELPGDRIPLSRRNSEAVEEAARLAESMGAPEVASEIRSLKVRRALAVQPQVEEPGR